MKKIGIVATHTAESKLTLNANYINWLKQYGLPILIDPYYDDVKFGDYDLIVLPGGSDVDPHRYGKHFTPHIGMPDRSLESFDVRVLPRLIAESQPIFGICRGMQTLNVATGGTLLEDVEEPYSPNDGDPVHYVSYEDRFLYCSSNHHQALDQISNDWDILMRGYAFKREKAQIIPDLEKVLQVEAISHKTLPIKAVQFHPEKNHWGEQCKALSHIIEKDFILPLLK